MMKGTELQRRRGFTIIELLIAVIIIGILVAVIIPVYSIRAEEARRAAAEQDLDSISNAQQHIAIDTGYFYRLYALDDVPGGDGISPENANDRVDGIRDEQFRTATGNPTLLFIDIRTGELLTNGNTIYQRLIANETSFNFNGPYLNVSRKTGPNLVYPGVPFGIPVDPWGNPYLLFTRKGVVDDDTGQIRQTYTAANGNTYNSSDSEPWFDRPTVLSLGPNGLPGDGDPGSRFGLGDDLYRQF